MRRRTAMIAAAALALGLLGTPAVADDHICIATVPGYGCVDRHVCKTINQWSPKKIYCLH